MRNLLILALAGVIVWLLIERGRLNEEAEVAKKEIATLMTKVGEAETKAAPPKPVGSALGGTMLDPAQAGQPKGGSWLDTHIDRGAKALSPPPKR